MMLIAIAMMAQAAAPAAPAAGPAAAAQAEQQVRHVLAARGMSAAGIDAMMTIQRRHVAALGPIIQRGRVAELGMRAALAKRPVDVDGFARSITARNEAGLALQREGADVAVEQLRALSPADRIILGGALMGPAPAPAPAAAPAKR